MFLQNAIKTYLFNYYNLILLRRTVDKKIIIEKIIKITETLL